VALLDDIVCDVLGDDSLEELAAMTVRRSVGPLLRTAVEGTLRLFGTSPLSLFSRLDKLTGSTVRGIAFSWEAVGPRSGITTVTYPDSRDVPISTFVAMRAGFINVFELCGSTGTVRFTERVDSPPRNTARFAITW
jgi:hypothetical protein